MDRKIEAVFVDIDGCIISTSEEVSSEYYKGLDDFSQYVKMANRGDFAPIGFCTGRDRNYIEAVSSVVNRPNGWSVIESGVALFNPRTKEIKLNPSLSSKKQKVFEGIRDKRVPKILEKYPQLFLYPGNIICMAFEKKYGINAPIEVFYKVIKEEMEDLVQKKLVKISYSDCAVDISPAGIDKASGLEFLSRETGINLKKALGIGDSRGDFPLFSKVGFVACPDNASKECKKLVRRRGGYISPYRYALGVSNIIGYFFAQMG